MAKYERFKKVYEQGALSVIEIWVDKETGVNYVFRRDACNAGGMTPLLDKDGKPVVSPVVNEKKQEASTANFCSKCGAPFAEAVLFCSNCGAKRE